MAQSGGNSVIEDVTGANNPTSMFSGMDISPEFLCYNSHNLSALFGGGGGVGAAGGNLTSLLNQLLPEMNTMFKSPGRNQRHASIASPSKEDDVFQHDSGNWMFCPTDWDDLVCWPETAEGQTVTVPCFPEFNGIFYDTSRNATRYCMEGGNWTKSDYSECRVLNGSTGSNEVGNLAITTGVYFFGYCVSLCALVIAIIIFMAFKELRCLRNIIHTHLMITYILADMLWIITSSTTFTSPGPVPGAFGGGGGGIVGMGGSGGGATFENQTSEKDLGVSGSMSEMNSGASGQTNQVPCVTFILLHYFHLTNFFWMFVEGLYLYVLVVKTFVSENIKLRIYACIGWGVPLVVVVAWSIAKWLTQTESVDLHVTDPEFSASSCLWLPVNEYDWIYKTPVILVLAANLIFLLQIMWVLITKLRSAMNPETQQSVKAAKALVVLMPLLGITYVLVLSGSRAPVYEYLRALLISTQGFLVSLLYCFLNGEVRQAIRHRWVRLRTMGPICCDFDRRRHQMQHMTRDWSPRSRTESIRYACGTEHNLGKRESVTSAATSVTTINSGTGSAGSGCRGHGHSLLHRESASPAPPGGLYDGAPTSAHQFHHQVPSTIGDGGGGRVGVVLFPPSPRNGNPVVGSVYNKLSNHFLPQSMKENGQRNQENHHGTSASSTSFVTRTERDDKEPGYLGVPATAIAKY